MTHFLPIVKHRRIPAHSSGLTLIETLVSLLVLAIGLLGLAMLQSAGLRYMTDSYSRSQATFFAYDIIERMRANVAGFTAGNYDIDDLTDANNAISAYSGCKGSTCKCATGETAASTACTSATLAQYDLGKWYELQDSLLTGAKAAADLGSRAKIERTGNAATVTLYWIEQDEVKSQAWQVEFGS